MQVRPITWAIKNKVPAGNSSRTCIRNIPNMRIFSSTVPGPGGRDPEGGFCKLSAASSSWYPARKQDLSPTAETRWILPTTWRISEEFPPQSLQQGAQSCWHLDFIICYKNNDTAVWIYFYNTLSRSQLSLIWFFTYRIWEILNLCCFKPPNAW